MFAKYLNYLDFMFAKGFTFVDFIFAKDYTFADFIFAKGFLINLVLPSSEVEVVTSLEVVVSGIVLV